jgi:8-oxo-dGTP diphosphatase
MALHCVVFTAEGFIGDPIETEEAIPHWMETSAIPYHDMWQDDQYWLPGMLEGRIFKGYFQFDQDLMLSHHIDWF